MLREYTLPIECLSSRVTDPAEVLRRFGLAELVNAMQRGDEIRKFNSPRNNWKKMAGRFGYALVREGKPLWMVMLRMNLRDFSWERMIAAVEEIRERACRASAALTQAGIAHVIIGGNAVAAWVARVDKEAVRNTKDVDLLVRREDFPRVTAALQAVGFVHQYVAGINLFLDGPQGSVRSAIHVVFAGEKVRDDDPEPNPDVHESEPGPEFPVPTLDAMVRMKLISFRLKDRVHLQDLLGVGLVDESWCPKLSPELAARLKEVIDSR
jgi:hypothetical protein